jgi:hypothetical protein
VYHLLKEDADRASNAAVAHSWLIQWGGQTLQHNLYAIVYAAGITKRQIPFAIVANRQNMLLINLDCFSGCGHCNRQHQRVLRCDSRMVSHLEEFKPAQTGGTALTGSHFKWRDNLGMILYYHG